MIYHLLLPLADEYTVFNVVRYISFRAVVGALLALLVAFLFGPRLIEFLRQGQYGQPVSEFAPERHATKQGTPTMGGVLILASLLLGVLLVADLSNAYVLMTIFLTAGYGMIGGIDDYLKVTQGKNAGLRARVKMFWQVTIAAVLITLLYIRPEFDSSLSIPFWKDTRPELSGLA